MFLKNLDGAGTLLICVETSVTLAGRGIGLLKLDSIISVAIEADRLSGIAMVSKNACSSRKDSIHRRAESKSIVPFIDCACVKEKEVNNVHGTRKP